MEEKRLYFKVPRRAVKSTGTGTGGAKLHIIGVIDASGSMSSWWKWIADFWNSDSIPKENLYTITFDGRPRRVETNILSTRINDHGGGSTAIPEAFVEFEKILQTIPTEDNVTAIFISDGQDSNSGQLEKRMQKLAGNTMGHKINFCCLGVQSGFPTFLSMRLRQLYHRGDENVPALYLIEYVSEKAFFNKFEGMRGYFYSAGSVDLDPPVLVYPWDESVVTSAYEGSWVICKSDSIQLDGTEPIKIEKIELSVEDAVEIFRGWIQKLQMESLQKDNQAQAYAKIAVSEMKIVIGQLNARYNVEDIKAITEELVLATTQFGLRAKYNFIWRYGSKIAWFFEEVDNLAKGVSPKYTSEFEAAKRMNIGTITGKHQQKALALKNIPENEFAKIKEEFVAVLQSNKAKATALLESLPAEGTLSELEKNRISLVRTLSNIKDFVLGLEFCKNQYDLFETLTFGGMACKVKRAEGYEENYRLVDFKTIYPELTADLSKLANYTIQWSLPLVVPSSGEKVEVNAFLPLFRLEHAEFLRPLLKTRLMRFMMTFMLTTNYDVIVEDAYLTALSSALILLFIPANANIREQFSSLIYESIEVAYGEDKKFQAVQDLLQSDSTQAVIQFKDRLDELFLHVFYGQRSNRLDKDQLDEIRRKMTVLFFASAVSKSGLSSLVKPDFKSIGFDLETLKKNVTQFFSLSEFRKNFSSFFATQSKSAASHQLRIAKKLLYETEISKLPLQHIETLLLSKYLKENPEVSNTAQGPKEGEPVEESKVQESKESKAEGEEGQGMSKELEEEYIYLASHVQKYSIEEAFSKPIDKDLEAIKQQVVASVDENTIKKIKGFNQLFLTLEKEYSKLFVAQHWNVQPLSKEELVAHCERKGVVFDTLLFDDASLLCKNACLSPLCPFFLQTSERFNRHLGGWQGKMPLGFHRFVKARATQTADKLYDLAITKWKGFPGKFDVTPEFARTYIENTLKSYASVKTV